MKTFEFTVVDELGIHARPAGLFIKCAGKFSSSITIATKDKSADAKRLFAVMGLGVKKGDTITVSADGKDENEAINELEEFCKANF